MTGLDSNNSFKPNLLRYTKAMAEEACHVFGSTTQVGLTQALGLMSSDPTAKVLFRVPGEDGGATVETLWAVPLGNDLYQLDNSPFFAYGVSWQDVVLAPQDPQEQMPTFQSVAERSGNRTVRVIFDLPVAPGNASDQTIQGLAEH